MRIGVLGATGPAGRGLAARLASGGHDVLFGSREAAKAETSVAALREEWGDRVALLVPTDNAGACDAPLVIVAVHADAAVPTVTQHADALAGRTVVSMTNNLVKHGTEFTAVLPPQGSVAAEMQSVLPDSKVLSAFHLVPAADFGRLDGPMTSDVVVVGDDDEARAHLMDLVRSIPDLRAFDGGSLRNAVGMEAFAAVLLTINVRHKGRASLRLAGL
jgi:8-hydroxy-5-deazaflavin:NADPH oxidoreductase